MKSRLKDRPAKRSAGRPKNSEVEARDQHIVARATELFIKHGFSGTSVDLIAQHANVAKRTLYEKYGDKAAIFSTVIHALTKRLISFEPRLLESTEDVETRLLLVAQQLVAHALTSEGVALMRVIAAEITRFPKLMRGVAKDSQEGAQAGVSKILANLSGKGGLEIDDPAEASLLFIHLILGMHPLHCIIGTPSRPTDQELRSKVRMFLAAYSVKKTGRTAPAGRQHTASRKG